jgi:O-antigen biosynthesis protein
MKVLFIGYVWPEPRSSAAGWRTLSLLDCLLARGDEVVFACAAAYSDHAADLESLGIQVAPIALNCSSFDDFVAGLQPELVVFDRFVCEEQFAWRVEKVCPEALRIIDTQDLHCLRDARHRWVKAEGDANGVAARDLDLFSDLAKRELAAIWRSDLNLIISEYEVDVLRTVFGVDESLMHYFPLLSQGAGDQGLDFEARRHCVVLGNFRHAPNWDALQFLRSQLWPEIRRRLPGVECHVYGAYPPPKAQQLHSDKLGFLIKGWATDAAQVMGQARLNLAPLRFGAGQKGKLLDAMEQGTPSITTEIGAESMAGDLPWGGAVVKGAVVKGALENGATQFIDAAVDLYSQKAQWLEAQAHGFAILEQRFLPERHRAALMARLQHLLHDKAALRRSNFIGQMLRHHSLRSHQYMSQWIEAKNSIKTEA